MNRRTFTVDILDRSSGDVRRTIMPGLFYVEGASERVLRERMCDCNLYAFRERGALVNDVWAWQSEASADRIRGQYIALHGCDHSMPPKRFQATRILVDDGREVAL